MRGRGLVTLDPDATARALVWRGLDAIAPRVPEWRREYTRALREGDLEAFESIATSLLTREAWEQNLDPEYLAERSFGFQIQHKARERLLRLLIPPKLEIDVHAEVRHLPDRQLLELVHLVGAAQSLHSDPEVIESAAIAPAPSMAPTQRGRAVAAGDLERSRQATGRQRGKGAPGGGASASAQVSSPAQKISRRRGRGRVGGRGCGDG